MCHVSVPTGLRDLDRKRHRLLQLPGGYLLEYLDCTPKQVQIGLEPVQQTFLEVSSSKTGSNLVHASCCKSALSCTTQLHH